MSELLGFWKKSNVYDVKANDKHAYFQWSLWLEAYVCGLSVHMVCIQHTHYTIGEYEQE